MGTRVRVAVRYNSLDGARGTVVHPTTFGCYSVRIDPAWSFARRVGPLVTFRPDAITPLSAIELLGELTDHQT